MKKIVVVIALIGLTSLSHARGGTYCKDFNTQTEAQKYFKAHNAKRLDRDKDGEACECLKGGSSYNKNSCKRWRKKHHKK